MSYLNDEQIIEGIVKRYPGITPFSISWVILGGVIKNGVCEGGVDSLSITPTLLARSLRVSSRLLTLKKRGAIKTGPACSQGKKSVKGYYSFGFTIGDDAKPINTVSAACIAKHREKRENERAKHMQQCAPMPADLKDKMFAYCSNNKNK